MADETNESMTQEPESGLTAQTDGQPDGTTPVIPPTAGLLAEVAEQINGSTSRVKDMLVSQLVNQEVNARVEVLEKAMNKLKTLKTEFKKLNKPDMESYNADGTVATASFTKAKVEEIKKAQEKLTKLEKAINEFLSEAPNSFTKLKEESNK